VGEFAQSKIDLKPEDLLFEKLRFFSIGRFKKYLVFHLPIERGIDVVRLLHGAGDIPNMVGEFGIQGAGETGGTPPSYSGKHLFAGSCRMLSCCAARRKACCLRTGSFDRDMATNGGILE